MMPRGKGRGSLNTRYPGLNKPTGEGILGDNDDCGREDREAWKKVLKKRVSKMSNKELLTQYLYSQPTVDGSEEIYFKVLMSRLKK